MAEIEPASDELVAAAEAEANEVLANVRDGPVEIYAFHWRPDDAPRTFPPL